MQKHSHGMMGLIASIAIFAATIQVGAVDMAWASGMLADIAVAATQANAALADAADEGADAVNAALGIVNAVEAAAQQALDAYAALEAAGDDEAAAAAAAEKLVAAYNSAMEATGKVSDETAGAVQDGDAIVNPDRILWQSPELQKIYAELFEVVQSASAQGGAEFAELYESDATPK